MPDPGEPRADQHPADRVQRRLRDLPHDHRPEGLKRGARETWREQEQKPLQRRWDAEHRRQPPWAAANEPPTRPRKWREQPPLRGSRRCSSLPASAQALKPSAPQSRPRRRPAPVRPPKTAKVEILYIVQTWLRHPDRQGRGLPEDRAGARGRGGRYSRGDPEDWREF